MKPNKMTTDLNGYDLHKITTLDGRYTYERRGEFTSSLANCAAVAAEIRRGGKDTLGSGFGEMTLS